MPRKYATEQERKAARRQSGARWRERNPGKAREYARAYAKKRRETDPTFLAKVRASSREWQRRNSAKRKATSRYRLYKVTPEQYEELLKQCRGVCLICSQTDGKALGVDHDHQTGKVRGLLCTRCNLVVGHVENNQRLLGKILAHAGVPIFDLHQLAYD